MFEELTPPESWAELGKSDDAILVDCRSPSEWHFTGVPDLSAIGKQVVLAAFADENGRPNPHFIDEVKAVAIPAGKVFVICRVGGRSANACRALAEAGFSALVNVAEGFEGRLDENGHRNTVEGWRFHGLPWSQS